MCKHIEIVVASRNAIVSLQSSMGLQSLRKEFSRREVAYDSLLMSLEKECLSCKADKHDPHRESDFLRFVADYADHYDGGKCPDCKDLGLGE